MGGMCSHVMTLGRITTSGREPDQRGQRRARDDGADAVCPGVDGIFDRFLDDGGRPFYDLASGDLRVDDGMQRSNLHADIAWHRSGACVSFGSLSDSTHGMANFGVSLAVRPFLGFGYDFPSCRRSEPLRVSFAMGVEVIRGRAIDAAARADVWSG